MKYKVISSLDTSSKFYSKTSTSRSNWLFISAPMMELLSKIYSGFQIISSDKKQIWKKHMLGLVDDSRKYMND